MGEASPRGLAHGDAGALVGALAAPALYVSPRALTVPKVIVDGQAGFPSQNKPLAKLIVPGATTSFSCFARHHPLSERAAAAGIRTVRVVIGRLRTFPSWQMLS